MRAARPAARASAIFDGLESAGEEGAEDHDDHQAGKHVFGQQGLPGEPDEIAQAVLCGHEFRGDDDDQRRAQAEPEPGEDDRQGARDDDVDKHLQRFAP